MKVHLRTLVLATSLPLAVNAMAQCTPVNCLPDLPAWGGLCAEQFLTGRVGEPYFDAISFHVTNACSPASLFDPTLTGASLRITQMSGFTFTGLPSGITGTTNQASYTPPANGCGALTGTPNQAGVFAATVNILVNVNVWPFSLTCGGIGPIPQNNNAVSFPRELIILPDPSFSGLPSVLCLTDGPITLTPTGTPGGAFSGPGVSGNVFDPAVAGVGTHEVVYVVSAQQGAAIAPATDSLVVVVEVEACSVSCEADAGTLTAGAEPCLDAGEAALFANPNGNAVVPPGFEVLYVLTSGSGLVIVDVNADPAFSVNAEGLYTIHTLVYDPNTLDLGIVEIGVTTGFDVNNLLVQGGGEVCASLDVAGAAFNVSTCQEPCDAFAGTLGGPDFVPCLEPGGTVDVFAIPGGDAVVPDGFEVLYVLTTGSGLVIADVNTDPEFVVDTEGLYTIHTLVYDPNTLDLGIVEIGVTTGFDIDALLLQGGGTICASLDVAGAPYQVVPCTGCDADAGSLSGGGAVCFEDGMGMFGATPNGDAVVPPGYEVVYVLTSGGGLVIVDASPTPEFMVEATGLYTIHTLVYDPNTLDLGIVEIGVTTGFDVNSLLLQGGGAICASLDVAGAAFTVETCTGMAERGEAAAVVFPNPSTGEMFIRMANGGAWNIDVVDLAGRTVHQEQLVVNGGEVVTPAFSGRLAAGTYVLRLQGEEHVHELRIVVRR
jgi:hypothetical protein